jgi:hypothetical protein
MEIKKKTLTFADKKTGKELKVVYRADVPFDLYCTVMNKLTASQLSGTTDFAGLGDMLLLKLMIQEESDIEILKINYLRLAAGMQIFEAEIGADSDYELKKN